MYESLGLVLLIRSVKCLSRVLNIIIRWDCVWKIRRMFLEEIDIIRLLNCCMIILTWKKCRLKEFIWMFLFNQHGLELGRGHDNENTVAIGWTDMLSVQ